MTQQNEQWRRPIRALVRGWKDIQRLRIQVGGRIVANRKVQLGQEPGKREKELSSEAKKILADLRVEHKRITDAFAGQRASYATFHGTDLIPSYTDMCLVEEYVTLVREEKKHLDSLEEMLPQHPIYNEFLKDIRGIGPAISAVLISEIDISKAQYPSSLWSFSGLAVESDGRGTSRRKEHLRDIPYTDRHGKEKVRKGLVFNPLMKDMLLGIMVPCLIRAGNEKYCKIYRDYKHRLENHPTYGIANDTARVKAAAEEGYMLSPKLHRDNMSKRYVCKAFLCSLHVKWRELAGLEVSKPYHEAKLGHQHRGAA